MLQELVLFSHSVWSPVGQIAVSSTLLNLLVVKVRVRDLRDKAKYTWLLMLLSFSRLTHNAAISVQLVFVEGFQPEGSCVFLHAFVWSCLGPLLFEFCAVLFFDELGLRRRHKMQEVLLLYTIPFAEIVHHFWAQRLRYLYGVINSFIVTRGRAPRSNIDTRAVAIEPLIGSL